MKYYPIELSEMYVASALTEENENDSPYEALIKFAKDNYNCSIDLDEKNLMRILAYIIGKKEENFSVEEEQVQKFINTVVRQMREELSDVSSITSSDFANSLLIPMVFYEWQKNKVVYKMNDDMCGSIQEIVSPVINIIALKNIPKVFWIDLSESDCQQSGALVKIIKTESNVLLLAWSFDEKDGMHYYNHFTGFSFTEENEVLVECSSSNGIDASFFVNLISFLQSDFVYIHESDLTKNTYKERKEGTPVKNKFSEVRIFDVFLNSVV